MTVKADEYFKYVNVDYAVRYTTRVTWEFTSRMTDEGSYTFQLQWKPTYDDPDATWLDVGVPQVDVAYLTDTEGTRTYGKSRKGAYRVVVTTPERTIYSPPAQIYGQLNQKQWRLYRAMLRRATKNPRRLPPRTGVTLKKKQFGYPCSCVDPYTKGVTNSDCTECRGTGIIDGYWISTEHAVLDTSPGDTATESANRVDKSLNLGTVSPEIMVARMTFFPPFNHGDVWVDRNSDKRYFVQSYKIISSFYGVPMLADVRLALLPDTDPVYLIDIDGS